MDTVVYIHRTRDCYEIFYVGIGSEKRAYDFSQSRNRIWNGIVKRSGSPIVQIVFKGLSWDMACRKEKRLIKLLGRKDNNTGQLANMTDGGDGTIGWIPDEKFRHAASERNRGDKNPAKTAENRNKISQATRKAMRSPYIRSKHLEIIASAEFRRKVSQRTKEALNTPEKKKKISDGVRRHWAGKSFAQRSGSNNHRSKPVVMMGIDGCKIAVFPCAYEVERIFGFPAKRINECCNGKRNSYKAHKWAFLK